MARQVHEHVPHGPEALPTVGQRDSRLVEAQFRGDRDRDLASIHAQPTMIHHQTSLCGHHVSHGNLDTRQDGSDKPKGPIGKPTRYRTYRQNPKQQNQPRHNAEQPMPLSFQGPFDVHAVFCLSFESTKLKRTNFVQMSRTNLERNFTEHPNGRCHDRFQSLRFRPNLTG